MSSVDDRTAVARIRDAAMGLFADRGVAGTSVRAVADAAGVSPALVMHHFGSKDGLQQAVDEHCIAVVAEVVAASTEAVGAAEIAEAMQAAFAPAVDVLGYLARAISEGGPTGRAFVDRFLVMADETLGGMAQAGTLRDGVDDLPMLAAVSLAMDIGMFVLRPHLTEHLGGDLFSPGVYERWVELQSELFARGVLRQEES